MRALAPGPLAASDSRSGVLLLPGWLLGGVAQCGGCAATGAAWCCGMAVLLWDGGGDRVDDVAADDGEEAL